MSCICQECGKKYTVDLIISDEMWNRIKPNGKSKDGGLLCGACIMAKIERISGYDYWYLKKNEKRGGN